MQRAAENRSNNPKAQAATVSGSGKALYVQSWRPLSLTRNTFFFDIRPESDARFREDREPSVAEPWMEGQPRRS